MNSKILAVMKKELARFFGDKRMVFTTLIMPGLMIYIMYSFMGQGFLDQSTADDDYVAKVYVINEPDSLKMSLDAQKIKIQASKDLSLDDMKQKVQDKESDLLLVFPESFDTDVSSYDAQTSGTDAPKVEMYYNSSRTESQNTYITIESLLSSYENSLCNKFDVNTGTGKYDLATDKDTTGQIFSMMLPMLMMIFMFSGCMAIAPEAIAGEKERGTIATLLVTPTKRSHLAVGKIVSLSILSLLSGASSFIGIIVSLPKLMQGDESMNVSSAVYSVKDYILILLVIFSTVLIFVSLMSIISAFAKSVKEATTYLSPLMILVVVLGISTMIGGGTDKAAYFYLIPIYNSAQSLGAVFGFTYSVVNVVITVVVNLLVSVGLGFILTKMFNSEKMMF